VCTNAASRARDGDPRFAPVALAGYTAADTPDPRVSLLRAPRLANLSPFCGLHPAVRATKVILRGARAGSRTLGHPPSGAELIHGFLEMHRHRLQGAQAPQRSRAGFYAAAGFVFRLASSLRSTSATIASRAGCLMPFCFAAS
jgi:hypothetical protein